MTEPNLRFPAVFCENLRFPAKICGFLRFPAPSKCLNFQEKGWICENLRFSAKICVLGSLCHLSSVPLSSPWCAFFCCKRRHFTRALPNFQSRLKISIEIEIFQARLNCFNLWAHRDEKKKSLTHERTTLAWNVHSCPGLVATIHLSPFTHCFRKFFWRSFMVFSATTLPNSHNHSYVRHSLSKFTSEWFTNHSNHIHRFTPITRVVATKCPGHHVLFCNQGGARIERTYIDWRCDSELKAWFFSDFSGRPWQNLPPIWVIHMATRRPAHNTPIHMSGGANYLPKFLPISFFRRASRFVGVSGHLALH